MTIRFRRTIKLAPFLKLNLGAKGAGISVGPRGLHAGISTRKGPYVSAGIPGTGLYVHEQIRPRARSEHRYLWAALIVAAIFYGCLGWSFLSRAWSFLWR